MNYNVLIQNRKSHREFTDRQICPCKLTEIKEYYQTLLEKNASPGYIVLQLIFFTM